MWAAGEDGLWMRTEPDSDSETIVRIPYSTKVTALTTTGGKLTINGKGGKWTLVRWNNQKGWVFGGYLSNYPIYKIENPEVLESLYLKISLIF